MVRVVGEKAGNRNAGFGAVLTLLLIVMYEVKTSNLLIGFILKT